MCQKFLWNKSSINFYIINIKSNFFYYFQNNKPTFKKTIVIECNKEIVNYQDITLNLNDGTFKTYYKTTTTRNMRNRTILQEQNRIDLQLLTCQQAYTQKTRHKRLTSEKDVNALWFCSSLYYVISLIVFIHFQLIAVGVKLSK